MSSPSLRGLWVAMLLAGCGASAPPPGPPPVDVTVQKLVVQPATIAIEYVAEAEASNTVEIRPRVGGLLERQVAIEGTPVKKGQVLFEIDPQPYVEALAQAKAALAQAEASLQQATRDLARVQPLSAINAVSQQELDAVVARGDAAKASVDAARASVNTAQLNLEYTTVTSPIDGILGRAQIRVGGLVTAYSSLLTMVYASDPMFVNFHITERRMLELYRTYGVTRDKPDRTRVFKIILADGKEFDQPATLSFVDAAVDTNTGTLAVRLVVPNPHGVMLPGQFARVVASNAEPTPSLLVPQRAVQELQGKTYLWIVGEGNHVENRDVRMGARVGNDWVVEEGAKAGETVVVEGGQKLRPGAVVNPKVAAAAPAGGAAGGTAP
ncbi:MAG TPA: efflux RND transporter periplasmic adaptor subunit [Nevskiaceae bacterium]|nr:efflux RND transporter periplasmic adaptor subunit [Nevskiaceae bacterium]